MSLLSDVAFSSTIELPQFRSHRSAYRHGNMGLGMSDH